MVSDSELVTRLREILQSSDLETTTAGSVRRQLEKDFGEDLTEKKGFISAQIDVYFETLQNEEGTENDVVEEDEEEDDKMERLSEEEKVVKKKRGGGFTKPCSLSPQLENFLGVAELARTEVVKRIWAYIREHNLQDPTNKKNIKCDEALHAIFRVNTINMFQMNKALSKHIWPLTAKDENVEVKVEDESITSSNFLSERNNTNEEKKDHEDNKIKEEEEAEEEEEEEEKDEEEEKEDEEEKEEEEETRKQRSKRKKKGRGKEADKEVKRRGGGFTKICGLSEQLQEFVGVSQLARTEVVKKLWAYIREHNLQDPKDRRNILCDDSLRALFRVNSVNMFQMNKHLSKHIWPLDEEAASENSSQKERESKHAREDPDELKQEEKQQKKGTSGILTPLPLSEALVNFIGTGENELSLADVVKRMWDYVKQNDLQDPSDEGKIICDHKLKELFEVDSFAGLSLQNLLTAHFIKGEQWIAGL